MWIGWGEKWFLNCVARALVPGQPQWTVNHFDRFSARARHSLNAKNRRCPGPDTHEYIMNVANICCLHTCLIGAKYPTRPFGLISYIIRARTIKRNEIEAPSLSSLDCVTIVRARVYLRFTLWIVKRVTAMKRNETKTLSSGFVECFAGSQLYVYEKTYTLHVVECELNLNFKLIERERKKNRKAFSLRLAYTSQLVGPYNESDSFESIFRYANSIWPSGIVSIFRILCCVFLPTTSYTVSESPPFAISVAVYFTPLMADERFDSNKSRMFYKTWKLLNFRGL